MLPEPVWNYLLQQTPLVVLLALILIGGSRRVWVFGWQYDAIVQERDRAISANESATDTNEAAIKLLESIRQAQSRTG